MTTPPIYVMRSPSEVAADFEARLLALGCSEDYTERAGDDLIRRAVQVSSSYESNAILSGRANGRQT
jgi:hypothetical protein